MFSFYSASKFLNACWFVSGPFPLSFPSLWVLYRAIFSPVLPMLTLEDYPTFCLPGFPVALKRGHPAPTHLQAAEVQVTMLLPLPASSTHTTCSHTVSLRGPESWWLIHSIHQVGAPFTAPHVLLGIHLAGVNPQHEFCSSHTLLKVLSLSYSTKISLPFLSSSF